MPAGRSEKSRNAILEAAAALFSRNPGASLSEVAETADVGRATLHRHFASREDLIRTLALDALRRTDEATEHIEREAKSAVHAMQLMIEAVVPLGDHFHFLATEPAAQRDPEIEAVYRRQLDEVAELVEAMRGEGAVGQDLPTLWVAATIDALIYTAWTAVREGSIARNDAATLVFRTLLSGIGPEPAAGSSVAPSGSPGRTTKKKRGDQS